MARLPKKPKAPKLSASLNVWQSYYKRLEEWKKRIRKIRSDKVAKKSLIERVRKFSRLAA